MDTRWPPSRSPPPPWRSARCVAPAAPRPRSSRSARAALLVALAIDAPKTRRSATLPEAVAFADARARAGSGLALEVVGGAAVLVAGGLMLALGAPRPLTRGGRGG